MATIKWRMKGQYIKNCNCIATCPCDTVGVPYPHKGCEGMGGMHIVEGHFGKTRLSGLNWIRTMWWPGPVHEGNGHLQLFIDQKATQAQRDALLQILSGKGGNPWFEILASVVTKVYEAQFVPITFEFDKRKRKARVVVPGFLETVSAPLTIPATGAEQRVILRMPNGMEYKEMEVAQAVMLRGTGAIKFDHQNTHSTLAVVEHTHTGLKA